MIMTSFFQRATAAASSSVLFGGRGRRAMDGQTDRPTDKTEWVKKEEGREVLVSETTKEN